MMGKLSDFFILTGLSLVTGGLWWIYHPAALLFAGIALFLIGAAMARKK